MIFASRVLNYKFSYTHYHPLSACRVIIWKSSPLFFVRASVICTFVCAFKSLIWYETFIVHIQTKPICTPYTNFFFMRISLYFNGPITSLCAAISNWWRSHNAYWHSITHIKLLHTIHQHRPCRTGCSGKQYPCLPRCYHTRSVALYIYQHHMRSLLLW